MNELIQTRWLPILLLPGANLFPAVRVGCKTGLPQRRRRGIFVEPKRKKDFQAPSGAASQVGVQALACMGGGHAEA